MKKDQNQHHIGEEILKWRGNKWSHKSLKKADQNAAYDGAPDAVGCHPRQSREKTLRPAALSESAPGPFIMPNSMPLMAHKRAEMAQDMAGNAFYWNTQCPRCEPVFSKGPHRDPLW